MTNQWHSAKKRLQMNDLNNSMMITTKFVLEIKGCEDKTIS